jgi:hypothetical protein
MQLHLLWNFHLQWNLWVQIYACLISL